MASGGEGTGQDSAPLPIRRPHRQIMKKPDEDLHQSITNQTYVSLRITKQVLLKEAKEKNLLFSPLTIQVVLGILASATRGQTLAELLSFLKSESVDQVNSLYSKLVSLVFPDGGPQGGPLLNFVDSVWIDQTVVAGDYFKRTVDDVYKAALDTVDFQTKIRPESGGLVSKWLVLTERRVSLYPSGKLQVNEQQSSNGMNDSSQHSKSRRMIHFNSNQSK